MDAYNKKMEDADVIFTQHQAEFERRSINMDANMTKMLSDVKGLTDKFNGMQSQMQGFENKMETMMSALMARLDKTEARRRPGRSKDSKASESEASKSDGHDEDSDTRNRSPKRADKKGRKKSD